MKHQIQTLVFFLLLFHINVSAQINYFVSPLGSDQNLGTKEKPFFTLEHAQMVASKAQESVIIYFRQGTYRLSRPIIFKNSEKLENNKSLIIKNFRNEKAIICGSVLLNPKWSYYKNGIYKTKVPPKLNFDQLIVNGKLQIMARYPNFDSTAHFFGGTSQNAISKERVLKWSTPAGGFIHALHKHEWGDFHYIITGKSSSGELCYEGGWQNNRKMGMHDKYRFVENIFEELDTINEWFYDNKKNLLYYYPPKNFDFKSAAFEVPQLKSLFEFKGSESNPVTNISLDGLVLTQTLRTFMDNKEPLLRSDWTIYRGGTVIFDGAVNCNISNCTLYNLGGNALFFNNYNRNCNVSGCLIYEIGASSVCFVGNPNAVRSPSFEYNEFVPLNKIDLTPGPKSNNFPAKCNIYNNLIFNIGKVEKQSAGVQLSMCQDILVSHNTIYNTPRAGININDGTWGGHIIEFNDVFNTVLESGDHGSFNSWGRDRYWHPDKIKLDSIVENNYNLTQLDAVTPIIIRNNRFRCDHGWDIDLDDGSSNYLIYNNLCLNGGLKLREGVNRTVENNILVNNSFHPHVWFKNSEDIFRYNIVFSAYKPIGIKSWGKEINYNLFPDSSSLKLSVLWGIDKNSTCGDPLFQNPETGNFKVQENSRALRLGFKNFCMDSFGVVSPHLKKLAQKVKIPRLMVLNKIKNDEIIDFMGAKLKNVSTIGEQSATGMPEITGVIVIDVSKSSTASKYLRPNDVILAFNNKLVDDLRSFLEHRMEVIGTFADLTVFRNQKQMKVTVELDDKK